MFMLDYLLDRRLKWTDSKWTKWEGEVNEPYLDLTGVSEDVKLEQLKDGWLDFTFFVRYSNGTVKQNVVRINVDKDWQDFYRLHRVQ